MRILIFNDSKWRDLPGNVLLKYHLETIDPAIHVKVVSFHTWQETIELFKPHVIILNHILGRRNRTIASRVKRNGGAIVVLYTEGIVEFEGKEDVFRLQRHEKNVDLFLCWNDIVSDLVGDRAVTVGSPRFDFYVNPLKKLIDSRELFCDKYNLDIDMPLVVFGDSWPSAKFSYSMKNFYRNDMSDLGDPFPEAFPAQQFKAQEHFKFLLLAIRDAFPLIQIVVKSHPMSDYRRWNQWTKEHGITLVHGEHIFNVLNAADLYVSKLGSITIPEAWLLDVPTITLGTEYDTASSKDQLLLSSNVDEAGDLQEVVESLLAGDTDEEIDNWTYSKHVDYWGKWGLQYLNSGLLSAIRILEIETGNLQDPNLPALQRALYAHDVQVAQSKADPFGNYDKTIFQSDVRNWQRKINSIFSDELSTE